MDLIVCAGITGLSYAAATSNDYLVIEKEPEIGGYCRTILQDGFIWDYSGHFFHFRNKDIERFVMDKMHKDRDIITLKKMTQIRYKNKHIDYPFQKNIHQLDKAEFIDCLYDLFVNEYREGTTFKSMHFRNCSVYPESSMIHTYIQAIKYWSLISDLIVKATKKGTIGFIFLRRNI